MNKLKEYLLECILQSQKRYDIVLSDEQREEILDNHYNELRRGIDDLIEDAVSEFIQKQRRIIDVYVRCQY